jgi:hypothetical protein
MILDKFKLRSLTLQIGYPQAFELWDCAGVIARSFVNLVPELRLEAAEPNRTQLKARGLIVRTELDNAVIQFGKHGTQESKFARMNEAIGIWSKALHLAKLTRISMRTIYERDDFNSLGDANRALFAMKLAPYPETKVFNQPTEGPKNTIDISYRFEDENSYSLVRVHTESRALSIEVPEDLSDEPKIERERHCLLIDFDRGSLKEVDIRSLHIDEWIKGYNHVMRRDIEKVIGRGA